MKLYVVLFLLFFSLILNAQEEKTNVTYFKNTAAKITALNFTSTSITELKNINWKDVKSIFDSNKSEETIELRFEIDLKESKNKLKSSFKVTGETRNIDSLIVIARKGLNGLIKMSNNYLEN